VHVVYTGIQTELGNTLSRFEIQRVFLSATSLVDTRRSARTHNKRPKTTDTKWCMQTGRVDTGGDNQVNSLKAGYDLRLYGSLEEVEAFGLLITEGMYCAKSPH
jgi:hypothetical protein